jgi:cbb3-type cytochrome oxidase maturation protein
MLYPATWLVLATVAIILVMFGMGYFWARTSGQLEDVEAAKHTMLEDDREEPNDGN